MAKVNLTIQANALTRPPTTVSRCSSRPKQMTIPNTFFHVAMAYAVLRHNGVDIGKMDFLGPVNWIDA
jgi:hypothetical protein